VLASDLDHASFVAGSVDGATENLFARAFDGTDWSAWKQFTVTTHTEHVT
jgi:hypothetical protein